jgi:uroporphyrinogen-III decarboxylase
MLTKKQNFLETIRGGKPDRFVNQYEFLNICFAGDPITGAFPMAMPGQEAKIAWGVTYRWQEGQPGGFPVHDAEHKVLKDITKWKDVVHPPKTDYPAAAWEPAIAAMEKVDREEGYATLFVAPGIFEECHSLMGIDDALAALYEEPEHMKELIKVITDYEMNLAAELCKYLKPQAIFHHDDWGSHRSSFMSPEMFDEFYLPSYKQIYGYYKSHGVEIICHHSDSYAANLVPEMIEMGIDVFQGCVTTNNVPELVKKYGGKISFMGDLDNGVLDKADWTPELVRSEVERACRTNGKHYFIPNLTQGLPMSTFPGVYEEVTKEIDRMSKEMF